MVASAVEELALVEGNSAVFDGKLAGLGLDDLCMTERAIILVDVNMVDTVVVRELVSLFALRVRGLLAICK